MCNRLLALLLLAIPSSSLAQDSPQQPARTLSVTGQGKATAPPDMATIHTGVVTQGSTAGDALEANNKAVQKALEVLKANNIAAKDIQTSRFDVQPEYRHDERGIQQPQIVGYRVTNQVTVHIRNLPSLGQVLDALVEAGSNQISGVSFGIDDATGVMNQARNRAVADARSRAELYAHAAGVKVGRVISISEQGGPSPPPIPMFRTMAAESAVPIATGEQEIMASVYMVFQLEDK
jgi:uncharacterized protein YggE